MTPAQVGTLQSVLDSALAGDTVRFADGTYSVTRTLVLRVPGVTLRSLSGNRAGVVIDGGYVAGNLFRVQESDVTVADMTVMRAYYHPVQVAPNGRSITGTLLHNLRLVDGAEQFIKVNPADGYYADYGVIRCSSLELTDTGRTYVRNNCYTGGIDIHQSRGWQILGNVMTGFWCEAGLSEHGIHVWKGSRDTVVDRNVVSNSARGIGFGLGEATTGRTYSDAPCGGATNMGHYGGSITNNFVSASDSRLFSSAFGFDTGIALEQSCETNVLHNTVASTSAPRASSIEWRFSKTTASIANNLVTHNLWPRDGARAVLAGNVTSAPLALFVNVPAADLHLVSSATLAIDKAATLSNAVAWDIDGAPRDLAPDVGADEFLNTATDIIAPAAVITSPANGQRVVKNVDVLVSTTDNVGVTKAELFVDGVLKATSQAAPFSFKWNAQSAGKGSHTLQVKVYDAAGNTGLSPVVTVYR